MKDELAQRALDYAFVEHVSRLFNTFCEDLKREAKYERSTSHALSEFVKNYGVAKLAHTETSAAVA
jgi:hypothetical protein